MAALASMLKLMSLKFCPMGGGREAEIQAKHVFVISFLDLNKHPPSLLMSGEQSSGMEKFNDVSHQLSYFAALPCL